MQLNNTSYLLPIATRVASLSLEELNNRVVSRTTDVNKLDRKTSSQVQPTGKRTS